MSGEDAAFFTQMRGQREAYHRLAQCIVECVPEFASVLDIGCGLGFVIEHFLERICKGGFDSLEAIQSSDYPIRDYLYPCDLRLDRLTWDCRCGKHGNRYLSSTIDLLISTETAEHIEEQYEAIYLDNITGFRAPTMVFSAAAPGQLWPGHVNLKPAHHWLAELHQRGYTPIPDRTTKLRVLMRARHAQHEYCADNFFILERKP